MGKTKNRKLKQVNQKELSSKKNSVSTNQKSKVLTKEKKIKTDSSQKNLIPRITKILLFFSLLVALFSVLILLVIEEERPKTQEPLFRIIPPANELAKKSKDDSEIDLNNKALSLKQAGKSQIQSKINRFEDQSIENEKHSDFLKANQETKDEDFIKTNSNELWDKNVLPDQNQLKQSQDSMKEQPETDMEEINYDPENVELDHLKRDEVKQIKIIFDEKPAGKEVLVDDDISKQDMTLKVKTVNFNEYEEDLDDDTYNRKVTNAEKVDVVLPIKKDINKNIADSNGNSYIKKENYESNKPLSSEPDNSSNDIESVETKNLPHKGDIEATEIVDSNNINDIKSTKNEDSQKRTLLNTKKKVFESANSTPFVNDFKELILTEKDDGFIAEDDKQGNLNEFKLKESDSFFEPNRLANQNNLNKTKDETTEDQKNFEIRKETNNDGYNKSKREKDLAADKNDKDTNDKVNSIDTSTLSVASIVTQPFKIDDKKQNDDFDLIYDELDEYGDEFTDHEDKSKDNEFKSPNTFNEEQAYRVSENRVKVIPDSKYFLVSDGVKKYILREGSGNPPQTGDEVTLQCVGFIDRTPPKMFWNTKDLGQRPFSFSVGQKQVIKGWDEAAASMKLHERSKFKIEAKKAYGKFGFTAWKYPLFC